ncbi:hypothetical protein AaE_007262, partial [Aphanomyces astaci]
MQDIQFENVPATAMKREGARVQRQQRVLDDVAPHDNLSGRFYIPLDQQPRFSMQFLVGTVGVVIADAPPALHVHDVVTDRVQPVERRSRSGMADVPNVAVEKAPQRVAQDVEGY